MEQGKAMKIFKTIFKNLLALTLIGAIVTLTGCMKPPPACFGKGEVGTITAIHPDSHQECYRGCFQVNRTTMTVDVNGLPRGCEINDQAIDIPVGTKVNFPFARRTW